MSRSALSQYSVAVQAVELAEQRQMPLLLGACFAPPSVHLVTDLPGDLIALLPGVRLPASELLVAFPCSPPFPARVLMVDRTGAAAGFERTPGGDLLPSPPPPDSLLVGMLRRCAGLPSALVPAYPVFDWARSRWAQVFLDAAHVLPSAEFETFVSDVVGLDPARLLSADCSAISWLLAEQLLDPSSFVPWEEARCAVVASAVLPPLVQVSAEWCDGPLFQMLHTRLVDPGELRAAFALHPLPPGLRRQFWDQYRTLAR